MQHVKPHITPHDAVAQGRSAWANPNIPDTAQYYIWHADWHRIKAATVGNSNHPLAEYHRKLALAYDRMANDEDRKSTRLNSSHIQKSRMPSSA